MDKGFSHYRLSKKLKIHLYLEVCSTLAEGEGIVRHLKKRNPSSAHLSVLGKVTGFSEQDFGHATACLAKLTATSIHILHTADIGKIFVAGSLSSLLMEKIDGKALGSLDGGIVGILNGYGISNKKTSYYLEHLKNGKLMIISWEYAQKKSAYDPIRF